MNRGKTTALALLAGAILIPLATPSMAAPLQWGTVTHFGKTLAVPTYFIDAPGRVMYDPPGSSNVQMTTFEPDNPAQDLRIYVLPHKQSPFAALQALWSPGETTLYSLDKPGIGVISGTLSQPEEIFYGKCTVGRHDREMVCFDIAYPAADKADMDPVVARISASFK